MDEAVRANHHLSHSQVRSLHDAYHTPTWVKLLLLAVVIIVVTLVGRSLSNIENPFSGNSNNGLSCPVGTNEKVCSGKGNCVGGRCQCQSGFGGKDCGTKIFACPFTTVNGQDVQCSGNGTCVNGACSCDYGFSGANCQTQVNRCPFFDNQECGGHGSCTDGTTCDCEAGYGGAACQYQKKCFGYNADPALNNECNSKNGGGACVDGACVCNAGWFGAGCTQTSQDSCPLFDGQECGGHGSCVNAACHCDPGYAGLACEHAFPTNPLTGHICSSLDPSTGKPVNTGTAHGVPEYNPETDEAQCLCNPTFGSSPSDESGAGFCGGCEPGHMPVGGYGDVPPDDFEGACAETCPGSVTYKENGITRTTSCYGHGVCLAGGNCSCFDASDPTSWPDVTFCPRNTCQNAVLTTKKWGEVPTKEKTDGPLVPGDIGAHPEYFHGPILCPGFVSTVPPDSYNHGLFEFCYGKGTCDETSCGVCKCDVGTANRPDQDNPDVQAVTETGEVVDPGCQYCAPGVFLPWKGTYQNEPITIGGNLTSPEEEAAGTSGKDFGDVGVQAGDSNVYDVGPCLTCAFPTGTTGWKVGSTIGTYSKAADVPPSSVTGNPYMDGHQSFAVFAFDEASTCKTSCEVPPGTTPKSSYDPVSGGTLPHDSNAPTGGGAGTPDPDMCNGYPCNAVIEFFPPLHPMADTDFGKFMSGSFRLCECTYDFWDSGATAGHNWNCDTTSSTATGNCCVIKSFDIYNNAPGHCGIFGKTDVERPNSPAQSRAFESELWGCLATKTVQSTTKEFLEVECSLTDEEKAKNNYHYQCSCGHGYDNRAAGFSTLPNIDGQDSPMAPSVKDPINKLYQYRSATNHPIVDNADPHLACQHCFYDNNYWPTGVNGQGQWIHISNPSIDESGTTTGCCLAYCSPDCGGTDGCGGSCPTDTACLQISGCRYSSSGVNSCLEAFEVASQEGISGDASALFSCILGTLGTLGGIGDEICFADHLTNLCVSASFKGSPNPEFSCRRSRYCACESTTHCTWKSCGSKSTEHCNSSFSRCSKHFLGL